MTPKACKNCGSKDIDIGWILSAGKIAFKSDLLKYPLEGGNVRSFVCIKCGYLESYVSEDYLEKIEETLKK